MELAPQRHFDEMMAEASAMLDELVRQSAQRAVTADEMRTLYYAAGKVSGYVKAWLLLDPKRAHRATLGAERFMRLLEDAEARFRESR